MLLTPEPWKADFGALGCGDGTPRGLLNLVFFLSVAFCCFPVELTKFQWEAEGVASSQELCEDQQEGSWPLPKQAPVGT